MDEREAKYRGLISRQSLTGLTNEEALAYLGELIDLSFDLKRVEGPKHAIRSFEELRERDLAPAEEAVAHYYVANAWANLRSLTSANTDGAWQWKQEEIEKEIIHRRLALQQARLKGLERQRITQNLTNLGNVVNSVGRFVEALEYWNRALSILPKFGMALGNRGYGLVYYASALYDKGHRALFLKFAHSDLKLALTLPLYTDAFRPFNEHREWIESVLKREYLEKEINLENFSLGRSKSEIRYRQWCLPNRLFLNPLNDLGPYPIAARDILTTPNIVTEITEGPYYPGFFNQMKQEFVSARFLYYEGINGMKPHFSDKNVLLYNTLDYPAYSLAVEKVKSAFRTGYSLLDKVAFFLNHYLALGIAEQNVNFKTLWYRGQSKKKGLRPEFERRANWPVRGLFWLSKDLYEDKPDFKECLEPDAQRLREIRNQLEHKYLKLHDEFWSGPPDAGDKTSVALADTLAFSVRRKEFEAKTLRLLKMVRAALIYLSLAIHREEQLRAKDSHPDKLVMPMPLFTFEDRWKM